ncbi:ROK family protein [Janibacter limosus]|uniref:ROK family protein n=1 Tax=Janibacter limosus TaxID=53458 RepID=UPI0035DB99BE|nr:ROK family protein [Janibacter limosus]
MDEHDDTPTAIGIDIGGTKIAGALVDGAGRITHREQVATPADDTTAIIEATATLVTTLTEAAEGPVEGIGIACAAFVDARAGHVWFAPNLPWRDLDLAAEVASRVDREVVVENDANAAARGEYRFGAGSDCDDMLPGDGRDRRRRRLHQRRPPRAGAFGIGGEVGHIVLDPSGPRCGCGNAGCLEVFASGTALVRNARELVTSPSPLGEALRARCGGDPDALTGHDITELAREGDGASIELLDELGTRLGQGIASICAVLDPGRIAIGGGVADAGDLLIGPTRTAFAKHLIGRGHRPSPEIVPATLGNDAGIVGAATIAREGRA